MIIGHKDSAPYIEDNAPHKRIRRVLLSPEIFPALTEMACGIVEIPPGSKSDLHSHEGGEMWFCISGRGHVHIGAEVEELRPGTAVWSPPDTLHNLTNDFPDVQLECLFFLLPPGKEKEIVDDWRRRQSEKPCS